jgi:hypothetical protein
MRMDVVEAYGPSFTTEHPRARGLNRAPKRKKEREERKREREQLE